jgi:hypothetical protein
MFGPVGTVLGGAAGALAGLAGVNAQYTGASAESLATAIARAEAGLPPIDFHQGGFAQNARMLGAENAILAPRIKEIMADPTFRATKNLTFAQAQSVAPRPATQALYSQGATAYNDKQAGRSTGAIAPGLSASRAGGGSLPGVPPLQTGALPSNGASPSVTGGDPYSSATPDSQSSVGDALGAAGSSVGDALSNVPGVGAPGMSVGDELLGAAGVISSGLASQKQGSLLNNALGTYNQNYNQGKGIITAAHPVDLSAAFANPSNPFYRPSAGAVPTVGTNGQPLGKPLVGVPPLSTSGLPNGATPQMPQGPPTLNLPPLFGHGPTPPQIGTTPPTAAGPSALMGLLAQLKAKQGMAPGNPMGNAPVTQPISSLSGVPPLNL